jgi:hypothetical protein
MRNMRLLEEVKPAKNIQQLSDRETVGKGYNTLTNSGIKKGDTHKPGGPWYLLKLTRQIEPKALARLSGVSYPPASIVL